MVIGVVAVAIAVAVAVHVHVAVIIVVPVAAHDVPNVWVSHHVSEGADGSEANAWLRKTRHVRGHQSPVAVPVIGLITVTVVVVLVPRVRRFHGVRNIALCVCWRDIARDQRGWISAL
jgi:hypothetical protein